MTVGSNIGFRQLVNRPDRSGLLLKLALPPEIATNLAVGGYALGGTAIEHDKQGWSSLCPDHELVR